MKYKNQAQNKNKISKKVLALCTVLVVLVVSLFILERTGLTNFYERPSEAEQPTTPSEPFINFDPPTEAEAASGDLQKEKIIAEEDAKAEIAPELANDASVAIVDATQYGQEIEVRAFASNAVEDGICTVTFERGSETVSRQVDAFADATTTPCINVVVPRAEFKQTGEWSVTVTYQNSKMIGSATRTLTIE